MKIEIWSDVLCPFCYIGKRNLEKALSQFESSRMETAQSEKTAQSEMTAQSGNQSKVQIHWKSFELDPHSAKNKLPQLAQVLAKKYGKSLPEAEAMNQRMTSTAAAAGLNFQLDQAIPTNSFDAHRLIHLATAHGKQDKAEEALFAAYLVEGLDIADPTTLVKIAKRIGLQEEQVKEMLESDQYGQAVRDDEEQAYELGVQGVPFFLINEKFAISGAQPSDYFLQALNQIVRGSDSSIQV